MAINLDALLKSLNKDKVENLLKDKKLNETLSSVDKEKAEKMIGELGLAEKAKNIDLDKIIGEVKNNPGIIDELKKLF